VFVDFTTIHSPYDGVITRRSFHPSYFIRAAEHGGNIPLLTVARTDKMRVVVKMPEQHAAFTDPGDPAVVELDAIPTAKFQGVVSRIANSEDRTSRSMRTEIDLPNESHQLRDGMFGKVTITLLKGGKGLVVPSTSVITSSKSRKRSVFVVENGKARLKEVKVGQNDGINAEILAGISVEDRVVVRPGSDLADGAAAEAEELELAGPT
jgi:RND family efflux transporter MFP subunit